MGKASFRGVLAVFSLLVLAVSLLKSLEPAATLARALRLAAALTGRETVPPEAAGFWFDPDYARFIADVKAATPEDSTVAVVVPQRPDLYLFEASYQLAPRRIVEERWKDEAAFVAAYGIEAGREPQGRRIAGGRLQAR